jgi:hypothetical protein
MPGALLNPISAIDKIELYEFLHFFVVELM